MVRLTPYVALTAQICPSRCLLGLDTSRHFLPVCFVKNNVVTLTIVNFRSGVRCLEYHLEADRFAPVDSA